MSDHRCDHEYGTSRNRRWKVSSMKVLSRMSDKQKTYGKLLGIILISVMIGGALFATPLGGGTIWQLDYQWKSIKLTTDNAPVKTFTSGATPGAWQCDPDGPATAGSPSTAASIGCT